MARTALQLRRDPTRLTAKVKLGLLIVGPLFGLAAPLLFDSFTIGLMTLALVFGLFAMSIDLLSGYAGTVTLGHAGILAAAAYGVGWVVNNTDGGIGPQVLLGMGAALVVTAVFAAMAMRTSGVYFIMLTLAQGLIIWGLSIRLSRFTGAENGLRGLRRPETVASTTQYFYLTLAVTLLGGALLWIVVRSPFGLAVRGLRESESRLRMLGYNTSLFKFYVFMVSGFFAAVAGILFAYLNEFISPSAAELTTSATGVLMVILGGAGTLIGPLVGSFIIVFVRNEVSLHVDRWPTVLGLIFIVTMLFARQGIVGGISAAWRLWLRRSPRQSEPAAAPEPVSAAPTPPTPVGSTES